MLGEGLHTFLYFFSDGNYGLKQGKERPTAERIVALPLCASAHPHGCAKGGSLGKSVREASNMLSRIYNLLAHLEHVTSIHR